MTRSPVVRRGRMLLAPSYCALRTISKRGTQKEPGLDDRASSSGCLSLHALRDERDLGTCAHTGVDDLHDLLICQSRRADDEHRLVRAALEQGAQVIRQVRH